MASSDLPELRLNAPIPGDVQGFDQPVAGGLGEIAQAASGFAARMGELKDRADTVQGQQRAAEDINAGRTVAPANELTHFGHAYNTTAKQLMATRLQASMTSQLGELYAKTPDQPDQLEKGFAAVRAAYKPTGFADLDAELGGAFLQHSGQLLTQAKANQRNTQLQIAAAGNQEMLTTMLAGISQTASGAPLDEKGQALIDAERERDLRILAKAGPAEAFSLGGIDFPADPTRSGAYSPEQLERAASGLATTAKSQQLLSVVGKLPTSAAQTAAIEDLRAKWAAHDPVLKGLRADDWEQLTRQLEGVANRTEANERADRMEKEQHANSLMEAYTVSGAVDPDAMVRAAQATGDPGTIAKANYLKLTGGKGAGSDFATIAPIVRDQFENNPVAKQDINGAWVKFGVNQAAFPKIDVKNLTPDGALAVYRQVWEGARIDSLPSGMRAAVFDAAIVHGEGRARAWAERALTDPAAQNLPGGPVQYFQQERLNEMHRLVQADPAKYGPVIKGWENRVKAVTQLAAWTGGSGADATAALMNGTTNPAIVPDGFGSDPIGYAYRHRMIDPVPLNPLGAFSGQGADVQAFGAALSKRWAQGRALASRAPVPVRMLQPNEVDVLKQQMKANPANAVTLVNAARLTIGPAGAKALLGELGVEGDDAAVEVHVAELAANGQVNFASTAARGLTLKAAGSKAPDFETGQKLTDAHARVKDAFELVPGLVSPALNTSAAAHLADVQSGYDHPADWYLAHAVGANSRNGVSYGGFAEVNGRNTIVPSWLRTDSLKQVFASRVAVWARQGQLPVYSNGQPMPAHDVMNMELLLQPDGKYVLRSSKTGNLARWKNGQPFTWDPERARADLTANMPGAVDRGR